MKKGFMFTTVTFLLLFSVFSIALIYVNRSNEIQESITDIGYGNKVRFIEDDVISNAYGDLLKLKLFTIFILNLCWEILWAVW